jgi:hypothetical protein
MEGYGGFGVLRVVIFINMRGYGNGSEEGQSEISSNI